MKHHIRLNLDIIIKFLIMCLILALLGIWLSLLDGKRSIDIYARTDFLSSLKVLRKEVDMYARTGFLSSLKVLSKEVVEKASCYGDLFCELEGDIRVDAKSGTIYVMTNNETMLNSRNSWLIRPYVRSYAYQLRHWTVKVVGYRSYAPNCTEKHYNPAILFSGNIAGHSLNYYHSFADYLFPLYITSFGYHPEVHLLITDYRPDILILKIHEILHRLTRYPILDIDNETEQVHCYPKMFVGLKFYGDLLVNKSSPEYAAGITMQSFRHFLRDTYSLKRQTRIEPIQLVNRTRPRLMIVSRKTSRVLLNEDKTRQLANEVGFDVVSADAELFTNRTIFLEIVNSCDVMMGIHGAGLTNMLFLPDNAVVIQIIPYGPIDYFAGMEFRDPTPGMNISYLEYKITVEESSLSKQYAPDDPIITDPNSYYAKGWVALFSVYLDNVNFTIDLGRFKGTLVQAMNLLSH